MMTGDATGSNPVGEEYVTTLLRAWLPLAKTGDTEISQGRVHELLREAMPEASSDELSAAHGAAIVGFAMHGYFIGPGLDGNYKLTSAGLKAMGL